MILRVYDHEHEIGNIQWSQESQNVIINWLGVEKEYQGKGYSYLLLIAMLSLQSLRCGSIQLDDCSDRSLTKDNVYYRTGFRIKSDSELEQMILHIGLKPLDSGYTYPGDQTPTPVKSYTTMGDLLAGLKNRVPINFMELQYTLNGVDITTGMMRRFKALGYIPSRTNTIGYPIRRLKSMLKYLYFI
jgi:hypothetical protein